MNRYYRSMRLRGRDESRVARRILQSVIEPEGCWHWQLTTTLGYGRIKFRGRLEMAHRVSYLLWVGDLEPGMQIDHLCSNRWCVNPHHLEQVTPIVNQLRASPRRTHCQRGHEFTPANTYTWHGRRSCRTCQRMTRERYAPRKNALRRDGQVAS